MIDIRASMEVLHVKRYLKDNPKAPCAGMLRELVAAIYRYDKRDMAKSRRIAKLAHKIDKVALEWA